MEQCYVQIENGCLTVGFVVGNSNIICMAWTLSQYNQITNNKELFLRNHTKIPSLQKYNLEVIYTRGENVCIAKIWKLAGGIANTKQSEWVFKVTDTRLNQINDLASSVTKTIILSEMYYTSRRYNLPQQWCWHIQDTSTENASAHSFKPSWIWGLSTQSKGIFLLASREWGNIRFFHQKQQM